MTDITKSPYSMSTPVDLEYNEAVRRVSALLKEEGFGILSTIDIQHTLKEKIDLDREPYVILGACNPDFASEALAAEPEVGVLLPCNVIVYQQDGDTHVSIMDPAAAMELTGNERIRQIASEIRPKLERVLIELTRD